MDCDSRAWDAVAAQQLLCGLSDKPGQFREPPITALLNQARRAQSGQADGMAYMDIPF